MASAFGSARSRRLGVAVGIAAASALVLAGCAGGGTSGSGGGSSLIVGTTDKVTFLDPAGSYDNGSFAVMNQVFPFLMNSKVGSGTVEPDIASSAKFTSDTEYTVTLKPGLTFANGNKLTSSDVKFTFERQLKINDPNGPASLLGNLDSVDAPDARTVVFRLKKGGDQTFPQVLSSPAGPIVDEQVFSADKITQDAAIVKGKAFAGPFSIGSYKKNNLVTLSAFSGYDGLLGKPKTGDITLKYFTSSSNLKLEVQGGGIDVAYRSLTPTDIADLKTKKSVKVVDGPGGEIRYIVFNFDTQPYGAKTEGADPAKALAVRQAVADLVDRAAIAKQVYKNTYTPLYSYVPQGVRGATEVLKSEYGDGSGGPSLDKAKAVLQAAGVSTPVTLKLQYNPDHYGEGSADEYALVKSQLEDGGLFAVDLASTEWVQYSKDRVKDVYPAYQLGWFPDYSDADNYLTPFFAEGNFLGNRYSDPVVTQLIQQQQVEGDPAKRQQDIEDIQAAVAKQLSTVPLLQGAQVAVVGKDVSGMTLDPSFKLRLTSLSK
ncbi:MAG: peptide ABC transporter substrate-binding protein [Micrococcales bacterium]|nr:peptide ABC transporter substrate-binding protein [Micrococcales bacterium]